MAKVQEYYSPNGLYTSPLQRPLLFTHGYNTSASLNNYENLTAEASMAQSLLQSHFRPENHMQQPQWIIPQTSTSSSIMSAQNQLWGRLPASSKCITWTELPSEPLIMTGVDQSMLVNNDLVYSHHAKQSPFNEPMDFGGSSLWSTNDMNNMAPSPSADILLSPVSHFSDAKHTYSPGPGCSPATSSRGSITYKTSKVSLSPSFVPPIPQSVIRPPSASAAIQDGLPMTPASAFHIGGAIEQTDDATMYSSKHSCGSSQSSSPGNTPWYPPGYRAEKAAFQGFEHQQSSSSLFDRRPNSSLAPLDRKSRQRQAQWSNRGSVPEQSHFQARFMAPPTADEKAQRTKDDEILIRMKQDGHTYKDIRKALSRKVAESTLRGRYRSLTKPRSHRVRAPKWTETDIMLLKRYVQEEFDKLDVTQPSLETKQMPDKVPWMKIVEAIATTGGSYKFGAATAKKKWVEVTRSAPIRSSR